MNYTSFAAVALAVGLSFGAAPAFANPIENACRNSDRPQATGSLCRCIGSVAQQTLTRDLAQQVRASRTDADNVFWDRYRAFGAAAEQYCAGR